MDKRARIAAMGGVSERTPRPLDGRALAFDLLSEANALTQEEPWRVHGHNARTLIKNDEFRLVLIALKADARMEAHQSEQHATLHTLRGRLRVRLADEIFELPAGNLLGLEGGVPHDVEAMEDSLLLLSMGWCKGR